MFNLRNILFYNLQVIVFSPANSFDSTSCSFSFTLKKATFVMIYITNISLLDFSFICEILIHDDLISGKDGLL